MSGLFDRRSPHLQDEDLSALADHELTGRELTFARRHLAECEACRSNLEALRQLKINLSALPKPLPVRSFVLTPAQAGRIQPVATARGPEPEPRRQALQPVAATATESAFNPSFFVRPAFTFAAGMALTLLVVLVAYDAAFARSSSTTSDFAAHAGQAALSTAQQQTALNRESQDKAAAGAPTPAAAAAIAPQTLTPVLGAGAPAAAPVGQAPIPAPATGPATGTAGGPVAPAPPPATGAGAPPAGVPAVPPVAGVPGSTAAVPPVAPPAGATTFPFAATPLAADASAGRAVPAATDTAGSASAAGGTAAVIGAVPAPAAATIRVSSDERHFIRRFEVIAAAVLVASVVLLLAWQWQYGGDES